MILYTNGHQIKAETMFLTMIPETHFIKMSLVPWFVGVHHIGLLNFFEQTESFTKPFTLNVKIYFYTYFIFKLLNIFHNKS